LYYRLRIISVHLPPLRARLDDIPALVDYFAGRFTGEYGSPVRYVSDQATRKLQTYNWPGNVRQLENCLRRAVLVCKGDVLLPEHIALEGDQDRAFPAGEQAARELDERVDDLVGEILSGVGPRAHASVIDLVERSLIARALQQCGHNQVRAARLLGISRNTLRHRIRKYNLEPPATDAGNL
jgi:DNA-binding NtrC family response regulator